MKRILLALLLTTTAIRAETRGPFYSPVSGFSEALVPVLEGFEKARIETTLRGFIARADSLPGFDRPVMEPSESGLYLNVAVRDVQEVKSFSDTIEEKGAIMHRIVKIPPPSGGDQAIVIEMDYGRKVSGEVLRIIDKCIRGIVRVSKRSQ